MKPKKILFVCKYNRFRSQIAEQLFKKYNRNKNIKVRSAGVFQGRFPLDEPEKRVANRMGINISKRPEAIAIDVLKNIDLVVIVANDVPRTLFLYEGRYLQKIIKWNIKDEFLGNAKNIRKIIQKIEIKVRDLIKQMEKAK